MSTFQKPGDVKTCVAPSGGVTIGIPILIGGLLVVPKSTAVEAAEFEAFVTGIHYLPKTTGTAWTAHQKLYWKVSTSKFITVATDGQLAGVASTAAGSSDAYGYVLLSGVAPDTAEGPQAAVTALTDNGGGTADGTVAAQAEPVTLTDSTGLSGTHDDTLAATTAPAALTENSGVIGGTSDGNLPALVDPSGDAGASVIAGIREVATRCNTLTTLAGVMAQNESDLAQKVIELVTLAATAQDNLKEVTTQVELLRARMEAYGVIAAA
jgi:predicted RecA/RadA family phage recombinase